MRSSRTPSVNTLQTRHLHIRRTGYSHNVLTEAVYSFMRDVGEGHHEDYMRAFFRLKAQDLGALLPRINDIIRRSSYEVTQSLSENLPQANDVVLVRLVFTAPSGICSDMLQSHFIDYSSKRDRLPQLQPRCVRHRPSPHPTLDFRARRHRHRFGPFRRHNQTRRHPILRVFRLHTDTAPATPRPRERALRVLPRVVRMATLPTCGCRAVARALPDRVRCAV